MPGVLSVIKLFDFVSLFIKEDLPALGLPTIDIFKECFIFIFSIICVFFIKDSSKFSIPICFLIDISIVLFIFNIFLMF